MCYVFISCVMEASGVYSWNTSNIICWINAGDDLGDVPKIRGSWGRTTNETAKDSTKSTEHVVFIYLYIYIDGFELKPHNSILLNLQVRQKTDRYSFSI